MQVTPTYSHAAFTHKQNQRKDAAGEAAASSKPTKAAAPAAASGGGGGESSRRRICGLDGGTARRVDSYSSYMTHRKHKNTQTPATSSKGCWRARGCRPRSEKKGRVA